jgi:outer membrane protein insertion porin family
VKRLLVILVCACGGSAPTPTPAPPPKPPAPIVAKPTDLPEKADLTGVIKKLRVQGATAAQQPQIEAALAGAKETAVGSDELRAALAAVMRVAGVADVTVRGVQLADGIELVVVVTGQPVVKKLVALEGGKPISLGIGAITLDGPLDPQRVQALAQTLRERYVTNGYFDADATWKSTPVAGGVEVTIEVVPGPISAIDAVTYTGSTVPRKDLDQAVAKWLVIGQPVVAARISSALEAITAYYWDTGYANVQVREPKISAGKITLAFTIIEGPRFKMGAIDITGIPASDKASYLKLFGVKQGDVFSRTAIAAGRDKISGAFVSAGKPNVSVLPLTKVDLPNKRISLTLEVSGI